MADAASITTPPAGNQSDQQYVFRGTPRNMVPGIALLFAGILAFTMGMTDVFFAEAIAWVFTIWGALLIYSALLDVYNTYIVTDQALLIKNPLRFWEANKTWHWGNINRMDIVVQRPDARPDVDVMLQVYFTPTGELTLEREDRPYDPRLAEIIIERAVLKPAGKDVPRNLHDLPKQKAVYTWNR